MTGRFSSSPPSAGGAPFERSALRHYEDADLVDRVWKRVQPRVGRSPLLRPVGQGLAAAALFVVGLGVGMGVEHQRSAQQVGARLSSEVVLSPRGPTAAPRQTEVRRPEDSESSARGRRVRSARFGHFDLEGDVAGEDVEEPMPAPESQREAHALGRERPAWLQLADVGDFAAAFSELDQGGGFDAVLTSGSAEELMTLADVARFAGRQGRAVQALRGVIERYENDPNAPLAAMMLGNLLQRAGDLQGAAEAYARSRALSPTGDFAEDALAREFDVAISARDLPRVRSLLAQYEGEFPSGRHLGDMQSAYDELARTLLAEQVAARGADSADGDSARPDRSEGESLGDGAASGMASGTAAARASGAAGSGEGTAGSRPARSESELRVESEGEGPTPGRRINPYAESDGP